MSELTSFFSSFPPNPSFKGAWVSIYFEPILGSEEVFTVAVAAIGRDKTYKVVPTIRKDLAEIMFGEQNNAYLNISEMICESLRIYIKDHKKISGWVPPISGVHTGEIKETYSNSLDGLIKQAISLTSSLSTLDVEELQEIIATNYINNYVYNNTVWQEDFKSAVLDKHPEFYKNFDRKFDFPKVGKPLKLFYLSPKVAINTGRLIPGKNVTSSFNTMKAKLLDLLVVRDNSEDLLDKKSHELIVFIPDLNNKNLSKRQMSFFEDSIKMLEESGDKHQLRVCAVDSVDKAAERIIKAEAA